MPDKLLIQEPLLKGLVESKYQEEESAGNSPPGCRINPSQFETISEIFNRCQDEQREPSYKDIGMSEDIDEEKIYRNIRWAIYGVYFHNLQYSTQIFERAKVLKRLPIEQDFKHTFPQRDPQYYKALVKILEMSDIDVNQPAVVQGEQFWNTWRLNGYDFTPKKHNNYIISPSEVKQMWEEDSIALRDTNDFKRNFSSNGTELNPYNTVLLNEVLLLTNIYFNDGNIQVPTFLDEVRIHSNFPNTPLEIIDYKTGKQFKQPGPKQRVQIFLMMTAALPLLDRANKVRWDNIEWQSFPYFKGNKKFISTIPFYDLIDKSDIYSKLISFKYVNPLTQQSIPITTKDLAIDTQQGIKNMLLYINKLGSFYKEYKDILRHITNSNKAPFTLPFFPIKNFLDMPIKKNWCSRNVQSPLL